MSRLATPAPNELQWMCAACGWVHYPVIELLPVRGNAWKAPDTCENCGHVAWMGSWRHVVWNPWYQGWEDVCAE